MSAFPDLAASRFTGKPRGIASICSAHPEVIAATLRHGRERGHHVLIEATCNQVNQHGGYTGMTPADFRRFVERIAADCDFDRNSLILGGDHLGPNPWRSLDAAVAMDRAQVMIEAFAAAGFAKLHLDASMGCKGEPEALDDEVTAHRAARLAVAADKAALAAGLPLPRYIIGTEIPTPGGAFHALDGLQPTSAAAARQTLAAHRAIFAREGAGAALERVLGLVVQPGVEFGHEEVIVYQPERARGLVAVLDDEPGLIFEAHSTDYQPRDKLAKLVADGFAILKVGPGLTFALREALYGLDAIALELDPAWAPHSLKQAMEALMLAEPGSWQRYYPGTPLEQRLLRHYSYSDRIRYYWPHPAARKAVDDLMAALAGKPLPPTLLRQFVPGAGAWLAAGVVAPHADACIEASIRDVLENYAAAADPEVLSGHS